MKLFRSLLVRTADEVAPPRREQWDKSQVHALTFMGNLAVCR